MRSTFILLACLAILCWLIISAVLPVGAAGPTSARATFTSEPYATPAPLATPMPTPTDAPSAYPAPEEKRHNAPTPVPDRIRRDTPCLVDRASIRRPCARRPIDRGLQTGVIREE